MNPACYEIPVQRRVKLRQHRELGFAPPVGQAAADDRGEPERAQGEADQQGPGAVQLCGAVRPVAQMPIPPEGRGRAGTYEITDDIIHLGVAAYL